MAHKQPEQLLVRKCGRMRFVIRADDKRGDNRLGAGATARGRSLAKHPPVEGRLIRAGRSWMRKAGWRAAQNCSLQRRENESSFVYDFKIMQSL